MSSFPRQFSDSPVLALPPQSSSMAMPHFNPHNVRLPMPMDSDSAQQESRPTRKRSRDAAAENLDPEAPSPEPIESQEEWVYGPGMVLIKPSTGYVADASSQSGTWKEEREAEEAKIRQQKILDAADVRNVKAQRLDLSAANNPFINNVEVLGRPLPGMPVVSPRASPVIDDFTMSLGIGWRRIGEDTHLQAAAKGWGRYIANHYPLTNVKVVLESKGLESYLVESDQGYFLFAEDLRQGRLVSQDVEVAMRHLQHTPPRFDGPNAILAAETPSSVANSDDIDVSME